MSAQRNAYNTYHAKVDAINTGIHIEYLQGEHARAIIVDAMRNDKFMGKCFSNSEVFVLADGRVVEYALSHGWIPKAAIFASQADFVRYMKPMGFNEYHEF